MAVGFLLFAAVKGLRIAIHNTITFVILVVSTIATYLSFRTPWIFPILILAGGFVTNLSDKRIPEKDQRPKDKMVEYLVIRLHIYCRRGNQRIGKEK
jgi:chromate transporter